MRKPKPSPSMGMTKPMYGKPISSPANGMVRPMPVAGGPGMTKPVMPGAKGMMTEEAKKAALEMMRKRSGQ